MAECEAYTTTEQVYLGYDNAVAIIPYSDYPDRTNWDMSTTTQVNISADLIASVATGDDVTANSADDPTLVWFALNADSIWQINMKIGLFAGITAGDYKIRIIILDPNNTNGTVVGDDLLVTVVDAP